LIRGFLPVIILTVMAAVLGAAAGIGLGRHLGVRAREQALAQLHGEGRRLELESARQNREMEALRTTRRSLSECLDELTRFAREVNTELDRGRLGRILCASLERMFDARQILVYFTADEGDALELETSRGFGEGSIIPDKVPMGVGRVGWVAEQQRTLSRDEMDRIAAAGTPGRPESEDLFPRLEFLAPMVHDGKTVGVIGVSGGDAIPSDQRRRLLRLTADLGSIALRSSVRIAAISTSANVDGLTRLANRRHFMERLGFELASASRTGEPVSLFLFDIDHFKAFNDANGHPLGDEVLRITGRLLRDTIASSHFAGRYGGEEFIIAMPGTFRGAALETAERVRSAIANHRFPREESQPGGDLTISGGLATFPEDGRTVPDLIRMADAALYRAKAAGRNRVLPAGAPAHEPTFALPLPRNSGN